MLLSQIIKSYGDFYILSFEEVGRAVRLLKPIYGKISQQIENVDIPKLNLPTLCKKVTYDFFYYIPPGQTQIGAEEKRQKQIEKFQLCRQALKTGNIDFYQGIRTNGCGSLIYLYINHNIFLSSFSGPSDDPEVWRAKQKKEEDRRKILAVEKRLDGKK